MGLEEDSLALRRVKRNGAGNRMRALLDGVFEVEEGFEEVENDPEFEDKEDVEGDIYESDFQSTDDEGEQEVDVGEKQIQREMKEARRVARRRAGLASSAHAPPKPRTKEHDADGERLPKKRKLNMSLIIDEGTGEVLDNATRKSSRDATVRNKHELQSRLKDLEQKKAALPKKERTQQRSKTQDELIRDALEIEEENTKSLNTFLTEEEERQLKNANLKKTAVEGPLLRWISRGEKVKIPATVEVHPPPHPHPYSFPQYHLPSATQGTSPPANMPLPYHSYTSSNATTLPTPYSHPPQPVNRFPPTSWANTPGVERVPSPYHPHAAASPVPPSAPIRALVSASSKAPGTIATQARNLVVLESTDSSPRDDMTYLFGDHVDWGVLKVLPKNRPSNRKPAACLITGLPARYVEPRSGIPFANIRGYRTINGLLEHQYVWSRSLGSYIADAKNTRGATGVSDGWERAISGVSKGGTL